MKVRGMGRQRLLFLLIPMLLGPTLQAQKKESLLDHFPEITAQTKDSSLTLCTVLI